MPAALIRSVLCLGIAALILAAPSHAAAAAAITPFDRAPREVFTPDKTARTETWPSDENIRASWSPEAITRTQHVRFTPRLGLVEELEVGWRQSDISADWDSLRELNERAMAAWREIEACAPGNVSAAALAYRDGKLCAPAHATVAALKKNLREFLATTGLAEFYPRTLRACSGPRGQRSQNCEEFERELGVLRKSPGTQKEGDLYLLRDFMSRMERPILHPFFTQLLLEEAGRSYPFLRIGRLCGISFFGCSDPIYHVMATFGGEFGDSLIDSNYMYAIRDIEKHGVLSDFTTAMLENEKKYGRPGNLDPEIIENYRVAHVSIRLLGYLGIRGRDSNCQAWGLWPEASHELVNGLRRSSGGPAYEDRMSLFRHLVSTCNFVARDTHFHFFMQGAEANEAAQFLARMGAWRKLPQ